MNNIAKLAKLKRQAYDCQEELYNLEYNDTTNTYCDYLNRRLDDIFEEIHSLTEKVNSENNL